MHSASKTQVESAFQVSTAMKIIWSSGWGGQHTQGLFKLCVLQHSGQCL